MKVMDTVSRVKITAVRYGDKTQVMVRRQNPPNAFVMELTIDEIEELCNMLKEETYNHA